MNEQKFPIPLNQAQEAAVKSWAADDRLWTTQETVEINLRTFARAILEAVLYPRDIVIEIDQDGFVSHPVIGPLRDGGPLHLKPLNVPKIKRSPLDPDA